MFPCGTVDQTYPNWLMTLATAVLCIGSLALLSLLFVPLDRSRHALPVWFRAHWFVPVLFLLWVGIGNRFPFSPHQLTRVLPAFLLGSDDWGSGNIYTFTKLADWLALLAGCLACARLPGDPLPAVRGFAERFRLCQPHLVAAALLHLLGLDNLLLYLWLLVGFAAVAGLQSLADDPTRRWSRRRGQTTNPPQITQGPSINFSTFQLFNRAEGAPRISRCLAPRLLLDGNLQQEHLLTKGFP